ncbi:hypothetical protein JTB14_035125 [Gonioctena quinquepunctata]|nr:hypothetical protein JTB14_035125 [Gonioctena quinquepunctata]
MKLLLGVLFSCFILEGLSIKCWDCTTDVDPDCGDPFDNRTLLVSDCRYVSDYGRAVPNRCRKEVIKENGKMTIIRSCGHRTDPALVDDKPSCTKGSEPNSPFVELCICNHEDGCNNS